jgi:hypothetical protein
MNSDPTTSPPRDPEPPPERSRLTQPGGQSRLDRLSAVVNRHTVLGSLVTLALTTAVYGLAVNNYVRGRIEATVTKRLVPYESILRGLSLNQAEEWDAAAGAFQSVMNSPDTAILSREMRILLEDGLLQAVSNVDVPTRYSPDFKRIEARLGGELPENGWRYTQAGWYALRTGHVDLAERYLSRAQRLHDSQQEFRPGADAVAGLMFVELAQGNDSTAFIWAQDASTRNPRLWGLDVLRLEFPTWPRERWYLNYHGLYGSTFTDAVSRFGSRLPRAAERHFEPSPAGATPSVAPPQAP